MIKVFIVAAALVLTPTMASAVQLILTPANVIGGSSSYTGGYATGTFAAGNIFDQQAGAIIEPVQTNYWIAPDNGTANAFITIDLGAEQSLTSLSLFNTHNANYNDRGTGDFTVTASDSVTDLGGGNFALSGAITTVVSGTLASESQGDTLTEQSFGATGTFRYLSFNPTSVKVSGSPCCGANVYGLNELRVFTADSAVPEPTSWALLLTGFAVTGLALRRRALLAA